jgi:hypothetical protein
MGIFSFLYRCQSTQLSTSSEHNSQQGRMVLGGPLSFDLPVQNPDANLPHLPHYHGGSSDEDDSGFQN